MVISLSETSGMLIDNFWLYFIERYETYFRKKLGVQPTSQWPEFSAGRYPNVLRSMDAGSKDALRIFNCYHYAGNDTPKDKTVLAIACMTVRRLLNSTSIFTEIEPWVQTICELKYQGINETQWYKDVVEAQMCVFNERQLQGLRTTGAAYSIFSTNISYNKTLALAKQCTDLAMIAVDIYEGLQYRVQGTPLDSPARKQAAVWLRDLLREKLTGIHRYAIYQLVLDFEMVPEDIRVDAEQCLMVSNEARDALLYLVADSTVDTLSDMFDYLIEKQSEYLISVQHRYGIMPKYIEGAFPQLNRVNLEHCLRGFNNFTKVMTYGIQDVAPEISDDIEETETEENEEDYA